MECDLFLVAKAATFPRRQVKRLAFWPWLEDSSWHLADKPTAPEFVAYWHIADNPAAPAFVRYWGNSGQRWILARDGLSAND